MAKTYQIRPSQVLGLQNDGYTAFCLDEACAVIMSRLGSGERCYFMEDASEPEALDDDLISFLKEFEKGKEGVKSFVN